MVLMVELNLQAPEVRELMKEELRRLEVHLHWGERLKEQMKELREVEMGQHCSLELRRAQH